MTIKPIDFQVILPKATEVSKIQNEDRQKSFVANQQQESNSKLSEDLNLRQVYSRPKAEEGRIKERQNKEQQGKKEEKKKKTTYNSNKKSVSAGVETSTIDIRL